MEYLIADITWRPAFHDPYPFAWLIVALDFLAAWLCFSAGRRQPADSLGDHRSGRASRFWFVLAVSMILLGLNKQLDLQTLLTQLGRAIARIEGWYAQRRTIQIIFVIGCAVIGLIGLIASFQLLRGRWRQCGVAYLGIVFLATFVAIRTASLHHVDVVLYGLPVVGNWMNAGLELGGALLVSLGAYFAHRPIRSNNALWEPK